MTNADDGGRSSGGSLNKDEDRKIGEAPKKKDAWDKTQILSGFVSGVVLAVVGLLINASIQNTQIESSKQIANIQASENEHIAESQKRLQESVLTGQFVQHLVNQDSETRQIAVAALSRALPHEAYVTIICIVLKTDRDPEVRKIALEQSSTLEEPLPCVAKLLAQAANDLGKPPDERQAAQGAEEKLQELLLSNLKPEAASLAQQLIKIAKENNIDVRLVSGYRSLDEQEHLVKRTPRVTNARVSVRNTGLAFDVGIFENGKHLTASTAYNELGALGKKIGLIWGGVRDDTHFETKDAQQELTKLRHPEP
jgi:D-alanyl-D-alanine carboxypeptidase